MSPGRRGDADVSSKGAEGVPSLAAALLEARRGAVAILDPDGRVRRVNRALRDLLGKTPAQLSDAVAPEDADRVSWLLDEVETYGSCAATLSLVTQGGGRIRLPIRLRRVDEDGHRRILLTAEPRAVPEDLEATRGWSGEHITTAILDVARASSTAKDRRELCQRAADAFFRVFPAPIVVVLLVDRERDRLSLAAAEGAAVPWLHRGWHLPLDRESPSPLVQAVHRRRTLVIDRVDMVKRFDEFDAFPEGEVTPGEVAATFARMGIRTIADTPIMMDDEVVAVIGMGSERERVDESAVRLLELLAHEIGAGLRRLAFEETRENLLELTRAAHEDLADYTYHLSHDVSEELRRVQTLSSLLASDYAAGLPEDARELCDRLTTVVTDLQGRVKASLDMANVLRKSGPPRKREIPLEPTIRAAIRRARTTSAGARTAFHVETPMPEGVYADPEALQTILDQILDNALKFAAPASPEVRVRAASTPEDSVEIQVEDNGPGVPAEYREHIFRPFRKIPGHEDVGGPGVGLALVAELVKAHQGEVRVTDREDGPGACFRVTLPCRQ